MSDSEIRQLLEMGATRAQAIAALASKKDVMAAAEAIFDGQFNDLSEEELKAGEEVAAAGSDEEMPDFNSDDQDSEDYGDDDMGAGGDMMEDFRDDNEAIDNDPYANIEMSKDRVSEVIEVEEDASTYKVQGLLTAPSTSSEISQKKEIVAEEMTRSEWMKGCAEGSENNHLFSVFQSLTGPSSCPSCGTESNQVLSPSSILLILPTFYSLISHLDEPGIVSVICSKCSTHFCRGCKSALKEAETEEYVGKGKGKGRASASGNEKSTTPEYERLRRLLHCGALQSAVLGVGLAQVERLFPDHPSNVRKSQKADSSVTGTKRGTTKANGDDLMGHMGARGGGRKSAAGTGFGGAAGSSDFAWQKAAAEKQKLHDQSVQLALEGIRYYLPSHSREMDPYKRGAVETDWMVEISAIAHIRRRFLPIAGRLLATNSLSDMLDRKELYTELFEWMKAFSAHEALGALLAQPLMLPRKIEYRAVKNGSREKVVTFEGSAGPRELTESIVKQCRTLLDTNEKETRRREAAARAAAEAAGLDLEAEEEEEKKEAELRGPVVEEVPEMDDNQKLVEFCKFFINTIAGIDSSLGRTKGADFIDRLLNEVGAVNISSSSSSKRIYDLSPLEQITAYEKWAKTEVFAEADMLLPVASSSAPADEGAVAAQYEHVLNSSIASAFGTDDAKRSLVISKELASLRVSLPSLYHGAIWLRVDEARVDLLKCCIAGPEGSPYDSGLFMFDIFLPGPYNQNPPLMKITTTKGGTMRFNPNLYADGKVCLSLLGTWSGPGWVPGKSTLLQVLLSVQSLVMGVDEPCANEPGWESKIGTTSSTAYSRNVRRMTADVAMLSNLVSPPEPWRAVVQGHFKNKGPSIIKLLDKWLEEDDGRALAGDGHVYMNQPAGPPANPTQAAASLAAVRAAFPSGGKNTRSSAAALAEASPPTKFGKDVLEIRKRIAALMGG